MSSLYELVIGTTTENESALIQYWEQFGFTLGESGNLNASQANQLYGVNSSLSGLPVYYVPPQRNLANRSESFEPFLKANPCVHEMVLIQSLTRQVLFQRHDYTNPNSGIVNPDSHFQGSEFVHVGLVVDCEQEKLDFYDQVLGLLRIVDNRETEYGQASRHILELKGPENGERMFNYYLTAPLTSKTDTNKPAIRSGNLEVFRFEGSLANKLDYSRPGSLGVCSYTMKVRDIESYYQRVISSEATEVTKVCENEFGEYSFSFVAPDGYFWTLLEG